MPTIRIYGVSADKVEGIKKELFTELAEGFDTPIDNINVDVIESVRVVFAEPYYPIIDVLAFTRPKEVETRVAKIISDNLKKIGYEYSEVRMIHLEKADYYCDGVSCE